MHFFFNVPGMDVEMIDQDSEVPDKDSEDCEDALEGSFGKECG